MNCIALLKIFIMIFIVIFPIIIYIYTQYDMKNNAI